MKIILLSIVLLSLIILISFKIDHEIHFLLGTNSCVIRVHNSEKSIANMVALHDNENTAVKAYESLSGDVNFSLYELHQNGERLLEYKMNNKKYFFDPNRIFSTIGIEKTLIKYNKNYPKELNEKISVFADSLLATIINKPACKYIIAIHNNSNNNFSVLTYQNSIDAKEVFISKTEDIDNFFLVTDHNDFNRIKSLNQNVVLQSENAIDDGSLSIYCQKHNIPYINIEAEDGQVKKQIKMITLIYNILKK